MYFACSVSVSGDLLDCDAEISDCPQQDTSNPLMVELRDPFVAKKLRLLEHELGCFILQIGWIAVFSQDTFY
jgi:hypothetical protein